MGQSGELPGALREVLKGQRRVLERSRRPSALDPGSGRRLNRSVSAQPVKIEWFKGGKLNVSYNCIDRHLPEHKDRIAYYWEPEGDTHKPRAITYQNLKDEVCRFANGLKKLGVKKGDRVTLYMPMIPETVFAMLACTRIGAVHSLVFAGFSPESVADRIVDCESDFVITADEGLRGGKAVPLKVNVDEALKTATRVKAVVIVKNTRAVRSPSKRAATIGTPT